jgi:hypothetical protein
MYGHSLNPFHHIPRQPLPVPGAQQTAAQQPLPGAGPEQQPPLAASEQPHELSAAERELLAKFRQQQATATAQPIAAAQPLASIMPPAFAGAQMQQPPMDITPFLNPQAVDTTQFAHWATVGRRQLSETHAITQAAYGGIVTVHSAVQANHEKAEANRAEDNAKVDANHQELVNLITAQKSPVVAQPATAQELAQELELQERPASKPSSADSVKVSQSLSDTDVLVLKAFRETVLTAGQQAGEAPMLDVLVKLVTAGEDPSRDALPRFATRGEGESVFTAGSFAGLLGGFVPAGTNGLLGVTTMKTGATTTRGLSVVFANEPRVAFVGIGGKALPAEVPDAMLLEFLDAVLKGERRLKIVLLHARGTPAQINAARAVVSLLDAQVSATGPDMKSMTSLGKASTPGYIRVKGQDPATKGNLTPEATTALTEAIASLEDLLKDGVPTIVPAPVEEAAPAEEAAAPEASPVVATPVAAPVERRVTRGQKRDAPSAETNATAEAEAIAAGRAAHKAARKAENKRKRELAAEAKAAAEAEAAAKRRREIAAEEEEAGVHSMDALQDAAASVLDGLMMSPSGDGLMMSPSGEGLMLPPAFPLEEEEDLAAASE